MYVRTLMTEENRTKIIEVSDWAWNNGGGIGGWHENAITVASYVHAELHRSKTFESPLALTP